MNSYCRTDTKKVLVSVIIINYNSAHYTIQCLNSIFEKTLMPEISVIVVDNNSKPDDLIELESGLRKFQQVVFVKSKINLGFSGGNMLGAQFAKAGYLFFLNNDTVLLNNCLSILYNFMEANPRAGICTGQMHNADMTRHHSFGYFPTLRLRFLGSWLLRQFDSKSYPLKKQRYTQPLKVQLVTGAAMFVRYTAFAQIGGFDTNFFLYCEEEDLALRMKKADFQCYVVPAAEFIHFSGKSTKRNLAVEKEFYISLVYYLKKHTSVFAYPIHIVFYTIKNLKKIYKGVHYMALAWFILRGAPMHKSIRIKNQMALNPEP